MGAETVKVKVGDGRDLKVEEMLEAMALGTWPIEAIEEIILAKCPELVLLVIMGVSDASGLWLWSSVGISLSFSDCPFDSPFSCAW